MIGLNNERGFNFSLSSSSGRSKLHIHGVLGAKEENLTGEAQKRKDQASSLAAADEDSDKSQKPHKSPPKPEKFIHLIPILTVLCFLVFYLSSHDPSQTDLAQFGGFHRLSRPMGINTMQESEDGLKYRFH
ncbi:uncharacterized protein LOC130766497 [Actinidia eriantha]|uniref:uncharacterized protein LOC130766497 n=1 Tax=Actinidia eriantha TaxID=165200 RepID=UPI0025887178|nr:uncharacterized protein LOC130766497 [Actinidia eriantha]